MKCKIIVDRSYKKKTNIERYPIILYVLLDCPMFIFKPSSRGQGDLPNVNHSTYLSSDPKVNGVL